jgi:alpha-beta hydrolase superfamily lysophospholipase
LLDDLGDVLASTRARLDPALPLILLGHSMGGLVAALHVALRPTPVQALVLSSPAFDIGLRPVQKLLLATLPRIAPDLAVSNGLDPMLISHDREVVAAYRADRLVHDRISGRLGRFIASGGPQVLAHAPGWTLPTLLMYAGSDGVVDARGSRAFAAAASPDVVSVRCFDDLYHEIFNETDAQPVFDCLKAWLDARFRPGFALPATAAPPPSPPPAAASRN